MSVGQPTGLWCDSAAHEEGDYRSLGMSFSAATAALAALSARASSPAGPAFTAGAACPSISTGAEPALPSAAECLEADVAHVVQTEPLDGTPKTASAVPTATNSAALSFATLVTSPTGLSAAAPQTRASKFSGTAGFPTAAVVLVEPGVHKDSEAPVPAPWSSALPGSRMRMSSAREAAPLARPGRPRLASTSPEQEGNDSEDKDREDNAHDNAAYRAGRYFVPALFSHVAYHGHFVCGEPLDAAWEMSEEGIRAGTD
jgi:hypothetical protein